MTDFVHLWADEARRNMRNMAGRVEKNLGTLSSTDSNYYRAHVIMAKAYRDAEKVFSDALAAHQNTSSHEETK